MNFELLTLLIASTISTYATYSLTKKYQINNCLSSSLVTASLIGLCYLLQVQSINIEKAIFGASFLGMSKEIKNMKSFILVTNVLFVTLFFKGKVYFGNFGGFLGMCAFISVITYYTFNYKELKMHLTQS